jgi:large subunit ribosomal protein L25
MEETVLIAIDRTENPKKARDAGFVPGVLNAGGAPSTSVKFEAAALNKLISKHGTNAKLWISTAGEKKFGFIKDVQRHPVERKIIHVSIQLVSADQEVKMHLPIVFHGREELEHRQLHLQVLKSDVEVSGKAVMMPDSAIVDVSGKEAGHVFTPANFNLPEGIRILDSEHESYAIIKAVKEEVAEVAEETATPEA